MRTHIKIKGETERKEKKKNKRLEWREERREKEKMENECWEGEQFRWHNNLMAQCAYASSIFNVRSFFRLKKQQQKDEIASKPLDLSAIQSQCMNNIL